MNSQSSRNPEGITAAAVAALAFINEGSLLSHPKVRPYRGTENGDRPQAWERDYAAALCGVVLDAYLARSEKACSVPLDKITSVTRAFDYESPDKHTPWVKVCFPLADWEARDAFAKALYPDHFADAGKMVSTGGERPQSTEARINDRINTEDRAAGRDNPGQRGT